MAHGDGEVEYCCQEHTISGGFKAVCRIGGCGDPGLNTENQNSGNQNAENQSSGNQNTGNQNSIISVILLCVTSIFVCLICT